MVGEGSLSCLYFTEQPVENYTTAKTADTEKFAEYFKKMLVHGNYFGPSQFESIFLSASHTEADIDKTLADIESCL